MAEQKSIKLGKRKKQDDEVSVKKTRLSTAVKYPKGRSKAELARVKAFNKERNRLKRAMERAKQRGYEFNKDFIPEAKYLPTQRDINKLKKIRGKEFYRYAGYYDVITGKYIKGTERLHQERQAAAKKAAETRKQKKYAPKTDSTKNQPNQPPSDVADVLNYMREILDRWSPLGTWTPSYAELKRRDKNTLRSILDGAVGSLGEATVATNVQAQAGLVKDLMWSICYGMSDFKWDDIEGDISAITAIIYGRTLTVRESQNVQEIIDLSRSYEAPQ